MKNGNTGSGGWEKQIAILTQKWQRTTLSFKTISHTRDQPQDNTTTTTDNSHDRTTDQPHGRVSVVALCVCACDVEMMAPLSGYKMERLKVVPAWIAWRAASRTPEEDRLGQHQRAARLDMTHSNLKVPLYHCIRIILSKRNTANSDT